MKKFAGVLSISCAFSVVGYAGDEQYSVKGTTRATQASPSFSWVGFYAGAFGGYKFGTVDVDLTLSGNWDNSPAAQGNTEAEGSRDFDSNGGEVGGLLGYNWQFRCWVVGLEAAGGYIWAEESRDTGIFSPGNSVLPLNIVSSFKTHYLATFGPRIGYAFGRCLPYVTGGLAIGDLDYAQTLIFPISSGEGGSESQANLGWMVAAGLQYAITERWSVRGQYQYIDLGSIDFNSDFTTGTVSAPAHHQAGLTEHNASFALIYGF
jgi:outer membrane immunogenic protein